MDKCEEKSFVIFSVIFELKMRRGEKKAGKRKLEMAGNGEGREKKEGRDGERKRGKGRGRKGRGVEEGEAK